MKKVCLLLLTTLLISCGKEDKNSTLIDSGSDSNSANEPLAMLSFASRKDNASFPVTSEEFTAFFAAPARVVATLKDELAGNATFTNNHSIMPSPLDDSDGYDRFDLSPEELTATGRTNSVPPKQHYLETIAKNDPVIKSRGEIVACGSSGTIEARIADCKSKNGLWAFYDGKKYGQDGEGDWKLVSKSGIYEVWRDERTKLIWSDKTDSDYRWFHAAGYSKDAALSQAETGYDASPGSGNQPANPISVCPDVVDGEIAAGGGIYTNYALDTETGFKAGFSYPQVTWRLPSRSDWYLAEVNGIRKVLPNMEAAFWTSTSISGYRDYVWTFYGDTGYGGNRPRNGSISVRCVASQRD